MTDVAETGIEAAVCAELLWCGIKPASWGTFDKGLVIKTPAVHPRWERYAK